MANARKVAVKVLVKIEKEGAYSNLAVADALKNGELNPQDKALATALIYGVLDRKITLDYILSQFLKNPVSKTEVFTLNVLRTALYQIKYMDKIPTSAAVNEAVKIMKSSKFSRNSGFVNGVLRSVLRTEVNLPQGDSATDLSIRFSCPLWVVESFLKDYGLDATKALLEDSLKPAPTVLRINTAKANINEINKDYEVKNNSIELKRGMDITENELYKKGLVFVQDYASQKAVETLNPKKGDRVLDLCAAPGGKSFTMACLMENEGEIIACDLYRHWVELIEKSARRLGLDIIKTRVADATVFDENLGQFDCVLCDVPCSGLGVIRRKPEIKYTKTEDLDGLEQTQKAILKKGGRLLYSTCTLRRAENENLVIWLKKEYNELYHISEHAFMPYKDGTDGFFCALFEKR